MKKYSSTDLKHDRDNLIARIASGEKAAEEEFVIALRPFLMLSARRMFEGLNAEDLVQEAFLVVLEKIKLNELPEPEKAKSYLLHVLRNLARNAYRKRTTVHSGVGLMQQLEQALKKEHLVDIIRQLPTERDREIIRRYYLEEETKDEICSALSLSKSHFERVLHRAMSRMKSIAISVVQNPNRYSFAGHYPPGGEIDSQPQHYERRPNKPQSEPNQERFTEGYLVEQYVTGSLTDAQEEAFENRMFFDDELRQEVEFALALKTAAKRSS